MCPHQETGPGYSNPSVIRRHDTECQIRSCVEYILGYRKSNMVLFFTRSTPKACGYLSRKHLLSEDSSLQVPIAVSKLSAIKNKCLDDTLPWATAKIRILCLDKMRTRTHLCRICKASSLQSFYNLISFLLTNPGVLCAFDKQMRREEELRLREKNDEC